MKAKKTKKYNYFYYGMPICEDNFKKNVPWNWEAWVVDGYFSWRGYDAEEVDEDEE